MPAALLGEKKRTILREKGLQQEISLQPKAFRPQHLSSQHRMVVLLHFLQSGKHGGRVLDEHSTHATTTRLWRRISGGTAPDRVAPGEAPITAARRPSWHVEYTHACQRWRFASRLNRVGSAPPVWCRLMSRWSPSGAAPLQRAPTADRLMMHQRRPM